MPCERISDTVKASETANNALQTFDAFKVEESFADALRPVTNRIINSLEQLPTVFHITKGPKNEPYYTSYNKSIITRAHFLLTFRTLVHSVLCHLLVCGDRVGPVQHDA